MKAFGQSIVTISGVMLLGWAVYSCTAWRFHECHKVGHSIAYCIWDAGR